MKYTFLLAAIAAFTMAIAQDNNYSPWLKKNKKSQLFKVPLPRFDAITGPGNFVPEQTILSLPQARLTHRLPNGNKVYALPQDQMPCIVPDMNQYNMLNMSRITIQPYRYKGPGAIPNPAVPILKESGNYKSLMPGEWIEITPTHSGR